MREDLTAQEAAKIIGVSDARIRQLAIAEKLPGRKLGRDWLFDRRDVEDYARRRRRDKR